MTATARDFRGPFDYDEPDDPDSTAKQEDTIKLKFPIHDEGANPGKKEPSSIDLDDPSNIEKSVEYDPENNRYYFSEKLSDRYLRTPTFMTFEEYMKYQAEKDEQDYWKRRMDALTMFNKKPDLPTMYKTGLFDRIFGGNKISVKPQGNVDVTFGGNWQNIQNPTLPQRAQKYGVFDFDMQMNVNLLATVGEKLKLNISNNTNATFDYQNVQKLEYVGKEDEIIKKIEAGNISFPLNSSLISGVQSLFGLKTQLQFGKLWVTAVVSQQRSKRNSLTIQGGSQTQQFEIKADDYEENRHFLLAQYFRNNYNNALSTFPVISSLVTINKVEVWVTNRTGATEGVRNVIGFIDLGEANTFNSNVQGQIKGIPYGLPDNYSNRLYTNLQSIPSLRVQGRSGSISSLGLGLENGTDYISVTARKLNTTEYSFNPQLGYISLNTQINPDDVLAVAFRYTYNGRTYQVGEFAEDLPPLPGQQTQQPQTPTTNPNQQPSSTSSQRVLFLKLLKNTALSPRLPIWDLMMKNVYALGGLGVSKEDFKLNVLYQDPGGGEKRYIPEGDQAGVPLIKILNLDRLNFQNDPAPDGIFDFVEGITINTQQGKIIFPVLEPFGEDLKPAVGNNPQLQNKYLYSILYDSTKTVARQFQQNNRYVIKGTYKSSSSSEIFLGGFNIPQGSVVVTAGGQRLTENVDYQIDYGLGRLKILNTGILNSGIPINVQYEDNATFGFQQQNFLGTRLEYFVNDKLTIGGTYMRLTERPFTQKTNVGEDPIKNTVLGLDANYQAEAPGVTKALDKLPIFSSSAPSFLNLSGEVATLLPGHPKQIDALDPEGSVYIDDFEGTRSSYDLKFPATAWTLATTPVGAKDRNNVELFPEATRNDDLQYGKNRARLAWYFLEPTLVDPGTGVPGYVKDDDANQHYIRLVQQQEVFPQRSSQTLQNALSTLDLAYFPSERGPYNFDTAGLTSDGKLANPRDRWGGIMRSIDQSDFEQSNVEFIEFWMLDPFIKNPNSEGGSLYLNLGNVSEDVLKDSRQFFENGIPHPKNTAQLSTSKWGYTPTFQQQITRAFDNDPEARTTQDVGYDGLENDEEREFFRQYLNAVNAKVVDPSVREAINADPANDDYKYFRDQEYESANANVITRYKKFNNPHGNSPVSSAGQDFSFAGTNIPESEDINRDNTLNESEDYYEYRLDVTPNMQVGTNYIINKQESNVKLPNGQTETETWYQFKIPLLEYTNVAGNISDFRSIRFMRMFLTGFQDSVIMRFARLELGRNNWRRYLFSLQKGGPQIPINENTDFSVLSVSLEENSDRQPIPYVIPPGVNRQQANVANGQSIALNEQALSLQVCNLRDDDARAVFKEVSTDMRQFQGMRMFIHAESRVGQAPLQDGDIRAIIRIGSDFINNYYEYQVPLQISPNGDANAEAVWPEANRIDLTLDDLVQVKADRNAQGLPSYIPYRITTESGNIIEVVGNPNLGDAKTMMLGVSNPSKDENPLDDGQDKCAEVWFNELRLIGLNETPGYAASAKVSVQMADLGNINLSGSMHTQGYGNIDQKLNQRFRDNFYQYSVSTNLNLGKLLPRKAGIQLPMFVGYSETISNPQYDPYDLDVKYKDKLDAARDAKQRDSLRKAAQDYTSVTSVNFSNVRVLGNPDKQSTSNPKPWSIKNFDVSYAYNKQFKRNPIIQSDKLIEQTGGLGYTYNIKSKSIEPFKKTIKTKSPWVALIRDFNFKLLPANVTFRTELNRVFNETIVRNVTNDPIEIEPLYFKNFLWSRTYSTRWELTRSLSFDYTAQNNSRIDEPYGKIDNKQKQDSLWDGISKFGRNTFYTQSLNASYTLPLQKIPATDWTNVRLTYGTTYSWTAASRLAQNLGNTIGNTRTTQVNGEFSFDRLYNKQRWLRAVNLPKPRKQKEKKNDKGNEEGELGTDVNGKQVKDLRPGKSGADNKKKETKEPEKFDIDKAIEELAGSMNDEQLDSTRAVFEARERARLKAEKEKKKRERREERRKKRATNPDVSDVERFGGRLLTMVKRTTVNVTENSGTTLPGYMDSTRFMGMNNRSGAPGFNFIYGYQPDRAWLEQQAAESRLSTDSLFNSQFQQQYSQNINIVTTVEPIKDLRFDISVTQTFTKSLSELFKDTSLAGNGQFTHNNINEMGSFTVSYIGLGTLFKSGGVNSNTYNQLLANRTVISQRLGSSNPYVNGTADPNNPEYAKGYTEYSQDVLIPSFIAAYTGKNASEVGLIKYDNSKIRNNPFKAYRPMPNWRVRYNGLTKIPAIKKIANNLIVNHAYTGTLSMNSFVSALYFRDVYNLGYPSFIDSNSGNFVPFFQVPNVTLSEQLNPLVGFDATFSNNMTASFEYRKTRTVSLSLIDYQVSETNSTEYVVGAGYRVRGLVLPFELFGLKKLKNDLNIKVDVGIRDDRTANNYLAQNVEVTTRGQKVITISPSVNYIVSDKLTLRFFFDRRRTIPYITSSYPITTTRAGVTFRFIFAQ